MRDGERRERGGEVMGPINFDFRPLLIVCAVLGAAALYGVQCLAAWLGWPVILLVGAGMFFGAVLVNFFKDI